MRLKTIEKLVKLADKRRKVQRSIGNHWIDKQDGITDFGYHMTCIARVSDTKHTISFSNGGWDTSSTNTALRDYFTEYVTNRGYKDVTHYEHQQALHGRLYR